mmetsp:Transcript_72231/g.221160  ORF Transcript_72231/g.221160 Transcript_72231/m.221160 type:complete len:229 (+) Transcript_72231:3323-4009(+)
MGKPPGAQGRFRAVQEGRRCALGAGFRGGHPRSGAAELGRLRVRGGRDRRDGVGRRAVRAQIGRILFRAGRPQGLAANTADCRDHRPGAPRALRTVRRAKRRRLQPRGRHFLGFFGGHRLPQALHLRRQHGCPSPGGGFVGQGCGQHHHGRARRALRQKHAEVGVLRAGAHVLVEQAHGQPRHRPHARRARPGRQLHEDRDHVEFRSGKVRHASHRRTDPHPLRRFGL